MLNFVHIGIGQCGNRFADEFAARGRTALAINTANVDMRGLSRIKTGNRIHIALEGAKDGAGRNPEIGRASMEENIDMVYDHIMQATDKPADFYVLWAGLGGGTGTGGISPLMEKLLQEGMKVILAMTLPGRNEGRKVRSNALAMLDALTEQLETEGHPIVPYLVIDNDKLHGDLSEYNGIIANCLVRFTNITSKQPMDSAFDDTDFANTLGYRGAMTLVKTAMKESDLNGNQSILTAVKAEWERSFYANFNPDEAAGAAALVIGSSKFLEQKGMLELIKGNLSELEKEYRHADPYSCIYGSPDATNGKIYVFTLLTCLGAPEQNLDQIYDDVSAEVEEDRNLRLARSENAAKSRQRRRITAYDPNGASSMTSRAATESFALPKNQLQRR